MTSMQARKLPQTHAEAVEFFLETESEEMEFEVARCRPMLTEHFFSALQQMISVSIISFFPVQNTDQCQLVHRHAKQQYTVMAHQ